MPPAVNQEINVNINALVKRIQDVKDLVSTIKELRGQSGPVIVDEKISKNAKASAGDVTQLKTSIENLTAAIDKMDEHKAGRLGRLLTVLGGVATILGHIKSGHEGIKVLQELTGAAPNLSNKLAGAGNAISNFFGLARDKISGAASAVKTKVASIVEDLPGLARGLAGGTAGLFGIAGAATVAGVALFAVVGIIAALVAALVAIPLIAGKLLALTSSAAETGSKFHDLAQQTGASVEILSSLAPVAEDSNSSIEDLASGIGRFNKLIGQAAEGSKEAKKDLKQFGIEPLEAIKNQDAALEKVFKRIIALPTGTEQAIAAQKAFGKSGAALIPTIIATGGNIEELKKKAQKLGVYWTTEGASAADQFGDKLSELRRILEGLALSIGRTLLPELLKLLRVFASEMPQAGGAFAGILRLIAFQARIASGAIITLIAAAKTLKDVPGAIAAGIATGSPGTAASILGDALRRNIDELTKVANTDSPDPAKGNQSLDLSGKEGNKKDKTPADTFDSLLDFRRAAAQHAFDLEKDLVDRLGEIYKTALDERKIAIEDFFDATNNLRERELKAELKLQQQLQAIEEDRLAAEQKKIRENKDKKTAAQQTADNTNAENKFFTATAPIATRIEQLKRDLADLPRLSEAAEKAALDSLDNQISEFLARVDEANGKTAAAAAEAIDREFKELLERVAIEQGENSPLVKLIREFIQVQKDRARVAQIDQTLQPLGQQFEIDRLNVEAQVSRHVITQREGRRQINALQKKYLEAQLQILKLELETTTEAKAQLEIKLKIANVENALANLKEIDRLAASINDSLRGSLEDFSGSLADGAKTLKQAFADLGSFILQMFARLAAAKLVQSIFGNLLGDEEGDGGIGGFLSGIFGGKKAAGDMMSARPGGQLIQVAEAGFDELVVSTDPRYQVRTSALLADFIRRTGILPRFGAGGFARSVAASFATIPRLAAGAFIPAAPAFAGGADGGGDRYLHIKQVNVYDPAHVHDAMRSDGGEQVFWNFVDRNATAIRRRLKI